MNNKLIFDALHIKCNEKLQTVKEKNLIEKMKQKGYSFIGGLSSYGYYALEKNDNIIMISRSVYRDKGLFDSAGNPVIVQHNMTTAEFDDYLINRFNFEEWFEEE